MCRELRQSVSLNYLVISFCRKAHIFCNLKHTNIVAFCHDRESPKINCPQMCRHPKKVENHWFKETRKNRCRRIDKITIGQTDKKLEHKSD